MAAMKDGKVANSKADKSFISAGFCNWKGGTPKFRKQKQSECYKEAVKRHFTLPKQTQDVGESLSAAHREEKKNNSQQLLSILRSTLFLAHQRLPLRDIDTCVTGYASAYEHFPKPVRWLMLRLGE
ncbi:hypothetical protein MAR_019796 [Mya arenaria]|uniref:Uncharacterized protein n=1 Tax=Mya arenaria TaxID=6604 RepID=A0ABY7E635_MYAAR|nr:hypothetical protein MAR_019796 [Mya arenaria]